MTIQSYDPPKGSSPLKASADRKPYQRPRIIHRESLEAMAADCTLFPGGKSDPTCVVGFS